MPVFRRQAHPTKARISVARLSRPQGLRRAAAAVFDPATLALEGWWRADYSATPWVGTASAGGSGGRNATGAGGTGNPTPGTAINGRVPADFDGVNDYFSLPGTATDYLTQSLYSGCAVVNIDAIDTDSATFIQNDCIIEINVGYLGVFLRSSGVVGLTQSDGAFKTATHTFATGGWHLVHWRFSGGLLQIGVDGDWGATAASGNLAAAALGQVVLFGRQHNGPVIDGRVAELMLSKVDIFAAGISNLASYFNARYALGLPT
jgi:hypothetical protein